MEKFEVKVVRKIIETEDIASFELSRVDGTPLPAFSAGSHVDVHIPGGIIRQYSICNDPKEQHRYRIAVLRDPASRGGSVRMHDAVDEGHRLTISKPKNHFPLRDAAQTLLFAGGIGITPLLCMAQDLSSAGADFTMHYCTRSRSRTAFHSEIDDSAFVKSVHFHFDVDVSEKRLDIKKALGKPDTSKHLYVCGPPGFIDFVVNNAKAEGWANEQIHLEHFGAAPQDASSDRSFDVKVVSTGRTYTIGAKESVVQVLKDNGIEVFTSCEQGVCGACVTRVLDGEPDHRDIYFTDEEKAANDQFTPCCSRAKSKLLVLDL